MKQQEVLKKIGGIIKELEDQHQYLESTADNINNIQLEFFVANIQYLSQNAELLRRLNEETAKEAPPKPIKAIVKDKEKFFEPIARQPEAVKENTATNTDKEKLDATRESAIEEPAANIDIEEESPADSYSFIRQDPEVIRHELEVDESWVDDENEALAEPEIEIDAEEPLAIVALDPTKEELKEEPIKEEAVIVATPIKEAIKPIVPEPVAPSPVIKTAEKEEVLTINQKAAAQLAAKADTGSSLAPISDLKSAINLNDKLLYIKELFNGYNLAYSEAIEILNRFKTFEDARQFLSVNYVTKNNWAEKPATTEKFYGLLRRRYLE